DRSQLVRELCSRTTRSFRHDGPEQRGGVRASVYTRGREPPQESERGARLGEEHALLLAGVAAEDRVPVREAAEARDDVPVLHREAQGGLEVLAERPLPDLGREIVDEALEAPHALLLVRELLAVHERHVEEDPLDDGQVSLELGGERTLDERERAGVSRVHARAVAPGVARELVEEDHLGEQQVRALPVDPQRAALRGLEERAEAAADLLVEGRALLEPALCSLGVEGVWALTLAEPEVEHLPSARVVERHRHTTLRCADST